MQRRGRDEMKYNSNVYQKFSETEKKAAVKRLDLRVLGLIFGLVVYIYILNLLVESLGGFVAIRNDYSANEKIILVLISLLPIYINAGLLTASTFERKKINDKFFFLGIFFTLLYILATQGLNIIVYLIVQSGVRKKLIKKIKPEFLNQSNFNESINTSDIDEAQALYALSDAIKLEEQGKYKQAMDKYKQAYRLGDARGAYYVARMFEDGLGCSKDIKESLHWEKMAADKGFALSQYYVGLDLISGKHFSKNELLGLSYLEKAANQEDYDALFYLGCKFYSLDNKDERNFLKAENYLIRAVKAANDDEELGNAYNQLGAIWSNLWLETEKMEDFKMSVQLYNEAKRYNYNVGKENLAIAYSIKPNEYLSIEEMLSDSWIDEYINDYSKKEHKVSKDDTVQVSTVVNNHTITSNITTETKADASEIYELKSLRTSLIVISVIKSICFVAGLLIVLYGYNNASELMFLSYFIVIGGVIIGGLPGLSKAFNDSYSYNQKWDRFFNTPKYKATVDLDRKTVKVRKNDDWITIIFVTLINLLKTACAAPFEVIRDLYRIIVINNELKKSLR